MLDQLQRLNLYQIGGTELKEEPLGDSLAEINHQFDRDFNRNNVKSTKKYKLLVNY